VRAGLGRKHTAGFALAPGTAVRPVRGENVVHVGHGDDARLDRDCFGQQAVGIAGAIHALVVVQHREHRPLECARPLQDPQTNLRMRPHQVPFGVVQRIVLVEDGAWERELADIVEQARPFEDPALGGRHTKLVSDPDAQSRYASVVPAGTVIGQAARLPDVDLSRPRPLAWDHDGQRRHPLWLGFTDRKRSGQEGGSLIGPRAATNQSRPGGTPS